VDTNSQHILNLLTKAGGKLPYNDKTDPQIIMQVFGISKKVFKAAIGNLYKNKQIQILDDGILKIG
jgi:hypothetical protein